MISPMRLAMLVFMGVIVASASVVNGEPIARRTTQPSAIVSEKTKLPAGSAAPTNYKALIVARYRSYLKDPYSVRSAEISDASPKFTGLLNGGNRPAVCVRYNAKNSFGAYIGIQTEILFFQNGAASFPFVNIFGCSEKVTYKPFPEMERIR